MSATNVITLTRYPAGSIREMWYLSFPLMLSSMSGTLMFFIDRLILASYSTEAMDAAVATGMSCFLFHFGAIAIASMAEVFVGQYNGAKEYKKLGTPVWQMIWFCLATSLIFLPLTFFGAKFLVPNEYLDSGRGFYSWLMGFGPLFALNTALSAFFVGKGTVRVVTYCVILANLVNFVFDIILVYGWKNYIPEMGATGAAIATVLAQMVEVAILFALFISKKNQDQYGTGIYRFDKTIFIKCLKIGWPNAISHMIEIAAWTFVMHILARAGEDFITVYAVSQGFFVLFSFAIDGLQKGMVAVASNLLGAKNYEKIPMAFAAAIKLHFMFIVFLAIPSFLYPDLLVEKFLYAAHNNPETITTDIVHAASTSLIYLWIYFFIDGIVWIIAGILTSAGKNLFVLFANAFNAWCFAIVPLWIIFRMDKLQLVTSWQVVLLYGFVNMLVFYYRYRTGVWKHSKVLT